jgi:hypothetical protein
MVSNVAFNSPISPVRGTGIATGYGLDGRGVGVRVPVGALHVVQTGSGAAHSTCLMSTGNKMVVKLTTELQLLPRSICGSIPPLPHMFSWSSARLVKTWTSKLHLYRLISLFCVFMGAKDEDNEVGGETPRNISNRNCPLLS